MRPCVHIIELHESVTFVHSDVVIKSMPDLHIAASYIAAAWGVFDYRRAHRPAPDI